MKKLVCIKEYEEEAKLKLSRTYWDYFSQGSCNGNTAEDNVEAYKRSVQREGKVFCSVQHKSKNHKMNYLCTA